MDESHSDEHDTTVMRRKGEWEGKTECESSDRGKEKGSVHAID